MRLDGVRAVVFDLDDTLYAEREYTRSGARAVADFLAETLGEREALPELLALEEAEPSGQLYSRWLASRGWGGERLLPALLRVHRGHTPRIRLADGARSLLQRLRRRYRLGLVSDGRLEQQRAKAQALDLGELLDAVVFSDELGREHWKPHPAPYHRALELLGTPPDRALYVGDNPAKDFLGARRAGMRSIRVRIPGGLHAGAEPNCAEAAPDIEIRDLDELRSFLT